MWEYFFSNRQQGLKTGMRAGIIIALFLIVLHEGEISSKQAKECHKVLGDISESACLLIMNTLFVAKTAFRLGSAGFCAGFLSEGNNHQNDNIQPELAQRP